MLCKLAWGNVRRARRDYLVYLVTLGIGVMVFYAFNTISVQVDIAGIKELGMRELMGSLMAGMTIFLAFVMGFLLVYANNFIMKRRKKEFGLYQVLGMSRWQVARVMALETVIVSVAALAAGLVAGIALSQLMVFSTAALFKTQVSNFRFFLSGTVFHHRRLPCSHLPRDARLQPARSGQGQDRRPHECRSSRRGRARAESLDLRCGVRGGCGAHGRGLCTPAA